MYVSATAKEETWVVDVDASMSHLQVTHEISPTLTFSRAMSVPALTHILNALLPRVLKTPRASK
eukprot:2233026-Alexandrium_andersonii.AAC.1